MLDFVTLHNCFFFYIDDKKFRIVYNNYMNDQINSSRVIIDDDLNIVYSAAHGPYGEPLKTWTNTYNPNPKFSGKEREGYTKHDYFGARYYDNSTFRFISVDPIINLKKALTNPQYWNLYAYCGNNPITYIDPDGRHVESCAQLKMFFNNFAGDTNRWGLFLAGQQQGRMHAAGTALAGLLGFKIGYYAFDILTTSGLVIANAIDKIFRRHPKVDLNKVNHIFGKSSHNLKNLLNKFGGNQIKAFRAVEKATQRYVNEKGITDIFRDISIKVKDVNVTVRGRVMDGKVKISTFFK